MPNLKDTIKELRKIRARFIKGACYAQYNKDELTMKRMGHDARMIQAAIERLEPAEPKPLSLDDLKNIPVGTVLWCDYREMIPGKEICYLPMSPVEFCGLGLETFEDTSVPVPMIYYSDGMDYQDTYLEDQVLWTGKPTEEQRHALDMSKYRRAQA